MKRTMGIALIVSGILFFIIGIFLYMHSEKPSNDVSINNEFAISQTSADSKTLIDNQSNNNQPHSSTKENPISPNRELEKAIEIAISDGVLSNNERKLIKKLADENDLDFESVIKDAEIQMAELTSDSPETEEVHFKTTCLKLT